MKLRDLRNLPVFCRKNRCFLARIDHGILDENLVLQYLVIKKSDETQAWIAARHFDLTEERAEISEPACIQAGMKEQSKSVSGTKCGQRVHDISGKQIGIISDFILEPPDKEICAVEVSRGYLQDFLYGRLHIPLSKIQFQDSLYVFLKS